MLPYDWRERVERAARSNTERLCRWGVRSPCSHPSCLTAEFNRQKILLFGDEFCNTDSTGECTSEDPRCMHQPADTPLTEWEALEVIRELKDINDRLRGIYDYVACELNSADNRVEALSKALRLLIVHGRAGVIDEYDIEFANAVLLGKGKE